MPGGDNPAEIPRAAVAVVRHEFKVFYDGKSWPNGTAEDLYPRNLRHGRLHKNDTTAVRRLRFWIVSRNAGRRYTEGHIQKSVDRKSWRKEVLIWASRVGNSVTVSEKQKFRW